MKTEITQLTQDKYEQSELYQSAVLQYEDRIKKLEDSLNSTGSDVLASKQETDILIQQNKLYYAKYLSLTQKYDDALDMLSR